MKNFKKYIKIVHTCIMPDIIIVWAKNLSGLAFVKMLWEYLCAVS